jgi:hypothetical protein
MLANVIVLDSFFEDPHSIVDIALKQKFYSAHDNPNNYNNPESQSNLQYKVVKASDRSISYLGSRTLSLKNTLEESVYRKIDNKILSVFALNTPYNANISISADLSSLFHALYEDDLYEDVWIHTDTVLYAGIVYLNEHLEGDHYGTLLDDKIVPYKFNRLVLYRADTPHTAMNGYGQDISNSRLTLNFFINKINIYFINNKGEIV